MGELTEAVWRRRPDNLKRRQKRGVWYFSYVDPATKDETGLGRDYEQARQAAQILNAKRATDPVLALVNRVDKPSKTVEKHVSWFDKEVLAKHRGKDGRPLAESTIYNRRLMLQGIVAHFGKNRDVATITRRECVALLEAQTPEQHNRYRQFMHQVFLHAVAQGLRDDNPIEMTVKKTVVRQRQRLTREVFDGIHAAAAPWFRRALDLALWSLQRREDLTLLRSDQHWKDGRLFVAQGKVEAHGTGRLRVTPGEKLKAAIIACLNAPQRADCPFLLFKVPERHAPAEWKVHDYQLAPEMLTREFQRLRDELVDARGKSIWKGIPERQRPSFHEIRSLGGDMYVQDLGWPREKVQALYGHTTMEMTQHYLDGHGEKWDDVEAA